MTAFALSAEGVALTFADPNRTVSLVTTGTSGRGKQGEKWWGGREREGRRRNGDEEGGA
jgi:hypothetical protein